MGLGTFFGRHGCSRAAAGEHQTADANRQTDQHDVNDHVRCGAADEIGNARTAFGAELRDGGRGIVNVPELEREECYANENEHPAAETLAAHCDSLRSIA